MTRSLVAAVRSTRGTRPVLVFLAGPNGAGKSTFFGAYLETLGLPFINADIIRDALRAAARSTTAEGFDRLAFAKAEELRADLLEKRLSFCTETVFSDPRGAKVDFLKRARSLGFWTFLVFIGLESPDLSVARVEQRVQTGGHDVPDQKLYARFPRTLSNLELAIPLVDEAFLFDNSSDLQPFRPVAVYSRGRLLEHFDPLPLWAAGIAADT